MYESRNLKRMSRSISAQLEDEFERVGLFFRLFSRVKSGASIASKIELKGEGYYDGEKKFIQDVIGIRIVFYFPDDIKLAYNIIKKMFYIIEEAIDISNETTFQPIRRNLVCSLPPDFVTEFKEITNNPILDSSLEIQMRTILSEGWHEVDHDLRYKCPNDWLENSDIARNFNGILATLETSEYAILRVFDQLKDIKAMFRTKFRLRLEGYNLKKELMELCEGELIKDFYKIERSEVIEYLLQQNFIIPLTLENLLLIINFHFIKNKDLIDLTPKMLLDELSPSLN